MKRVEDMIKDIMTIIKEYNFTNPDGCCSSSAHNDTMNALINCVGRYIHSTFYSNTSQIQKFCDTLPKIIDMLDKIEKKEQIDYYMEKQY